ncbi:MAG TPA: zinc-binding dehydrogenase [Micromonosporaceae bacterium]|nr:zinc-binding dehydrogenase [Micromonosporaceae bacterium]
MRAAVIKEFGPPEVLATTDVPAPQATGDEALIAVWFANVTFVETQIRAGRPPHPSMLPPLPAILGNGVGGVVTAVGPSGDPELVGRTVVASLSGSGGYAEQAVTAAARLIPVPDGVTMRDAVALLADGRTAMSLLRRADVREGDTVVIEAAAGGVGTLLIQLARNAGARVVALAGGDRKLTLAADLGADVTVDYRTGDWSSRVRDAVGAADVVFDGVGGDVGAAAFRLLRPGGRFCPFGMASGGAAPVTADIARAARVDVRGGGPMSLEESVSLSRAALDEAAAGRLRPVIGQEHPLADAAAAHAAIEARATVGKTLLTVA